SISNNALIFYHTYTIESKKKSVYFTDFSIKTSFSLEYRDGFERLLGSEETRPPELNDGLELKHLLATIFDELRLSCVSSESSPYASQSFTAN
ncbi:hypothetical protein, partial [Sutterella wadsworthensis]